MLVQPLQSNSVIRKFSQQLVTASWLLPPVVKEGMPFMLVFCVFWHKKHNSQPCLGTQLPGQFLRQITYVMLASDSGRMDHIFLTDMTSKYLLIFC